MKLSPLLCINEEKQKLRVTSFDSPHFLSLFFSHCRVSLTRHEPGRIPRAEADGLSQEELLAAGSSDAAPGGVVVVLCSGGEFDLNVIGRSRNQFSSAMLCLALLLELLVLLLGADAPIACALEGASATTCRRILSRIRVVVLFVFLFFFKQRRRRSKGRRRRRGRRRRTIELELVLRRAAAAARRLPRRGAPARDRNEPSSASAVSRRF